VALTRLWSAPSFEGLSRYIPHVAFRFSFEKVLTWPLLKCVYVFLGPSAVIVLVGLLKTCELLTWGITWHGTSWSMQLSWWQTFWEFDEVGVS
jgi:hypothetical protein